MVTGRHWVMVTVFVSASWQLVAAERSTVKLRGVTTYSPAAELGASAGALPLDAASQAETVVCTEADPDGLRIARGAYRNGQRHGKWTRWFKESEGPMFAAPDYADFSRPFTIEVELADGVLNGTWQVHDSQKRRVCRWEFRNGKVEGTLVWWYADGQKRREAHFHNGLVEGELREWGTNQELRVQQQYARGKPVEPVQELFDNGKIECEGTHLLASDVTESTFDWHAGAVTTVLLESATESKKHGHWVWWYSNGRKELEGVYENGAAVGRFTWWYENGQKHMEACYKGGKRDGQTVVWHTNGLKSMQGMYAADVQVGTWKHWNEDGRLLDQHDDVQGDTTDQPVVTNARPAVTPADSQSDALEPIAVSTSVGATSAPAPSDQPVPLETTATSTDQSADSAIKIVAGADAAAPIPAVATRIESGNSSERAPNSLITPAARPNSLRSPAAQPGSALKRLR